jgi:UDP-glucose 4-epimerase
VHILVTGGSGFIGHHLVNKLLSNGENKVVVIDNLSTRNNNLLEITIKSSLRKSLSFYNEDILNKDVIYDIFKHEATIDTCVHLAAKISVLDSVRNPADTVHTNVIGTLNLLEVCSFNNVKNFVFASSAAVYGEPKKMPLHENDSLEPLSPYGASKASAEALASSFARCGKLENVMSIRIFNVYGHNQSSQYAGVITSFAERLSKMLPPIIYGGGEQTRDFISVNDLINIILLLIEGKRRLSHCILNAGTGKPTKIRDLAKIMIKIAGLDLEPIFAEPKRGDIKESYADIEKLKTDLGFTNFTEIEHGLKQILKVQA